MYGVGLFVLIIATMIVMPFLWVLSQVGQWMQWPFNWLRFFVVISESEFKK
jgi:hypothetical protein